jgi:hypothetical protein
MTQRRPSELAEVIDLWQCGCNLQVSELADVIDALMKRYSKGNDRAKHGEIGDETRFEAWIA